MGLCTDGEKQMNENEEKLLKRISSSSSSNWRRLINDCHLLSELNITKKQLIKAANGLRRKGLINYDRAYEDKAVYQLKH